jgi:hypothetical protein
VHTCHYQLLKACLKHDYIGIQTLNIRKLISQIQNTRQQAWDPKSGRMHIRTVDEYYVEYTAMVNLLPTNTTTYPFDVVQTFWGGLIEDIQRKAISHRWEPPAATSIPEISEKAINRLCIARDQALAFELMVQDTNDLVAQQHGGFGMLQSNPIHQAPSVHEIPDVDLSAYQPQPCEPLIPDTDPFTSRTTELEETWEEEGYPSLHVAELCAQLANPATTPSVRRAIYASLFNDHGPDGEEGAAATPKSNANRPKCARTDTFIASIHGGVHF